MRIPGVAPCGAATWPRLGGVVAVLVCLLTPSLVHGQTRRRRAPAVRPSPPASVSPAVEEPTQTPAAPHPPPRTATARPAPVVAASAVPPAPSGGSPGFLLLGLAGGYGANLSDGQEFLGPGVGGRASYTFGSSGLAHFFLGGEFTYHTGYSLQLSSWDRGGTLSQKGSLFGLNLGVDLVFDHVSLRVYGMMGAYSSRVLCESCSESFDLNSTTLAVGFGASLIGYVSSVYFGIDARLASVSDSEDWRTSAFLTVGTTASVYGLLGVRIR